MKKDRAAVVLCEGARKLCWDFTCCMMANASVIRGTAEEDSELLCVLVELMDEWYVKYPSWKRYVMTTILNRFTEIFKCMDDVAFNKTNASSST